MQANICMCCGEVFEPSGDEAVCSYCAEELAEAIDHPQSEWKAECENDDKADNLQ